jgi:hypothetical protein
LIINNGFEITSKLLRLAFCRDRSSNTKRKDSERIIGVLAEI